MDGILGNGIDSKLLSRIEGNELSFSSNTPSATSKPDRISQGSLHKFNHGQLERKFTDIPYDFEDDDEDREDTENGLITDANETLEYDSSGLAIPRLRNSMTPWRAVEKSSKRDSKQSSPTTSRPTTRNSLFSLEGGYNMASTSGSHELEQLQKQLTTYKLKVRTLLELIKQLNYGDDEKKVRDSFYGKLLATMSQYDEIEELKRHIFELENNNEVKQKLVTSLQEELAIIGKKLLDTKNEHAETLEYANEYLEHSEVLAKNIDDMLTLLLENLDVSEEERDALQKARQISPSFAMVKMNAVMSTFRRVLKDKKSNSLVEYEDNEDSMQPTAAIANSTAIENSQGEELLDRGTPLVNGEHVFKGVPANNNSYALDGSFIDTRLEIAIEGLHEEYEKFIQGIREKVETSASLEEVLLHKLSEQDTLLSRISTKINSDKYFAMQKVDIGETSLRTTNGSFKDSTEVHHSKVDHSRSLNSLVENLKNTIDNQNQKLELFKGQLLEFETLRKSEHRLKIELQDHRELSQVKERNWENFSSDLEKTIHVLQNEKVGLLDMVDQLSAELDIKNRELEKSGKDLKKIARSSNNQLSSHKEEIERWRKLLQDRENQISQLTYDCDHLHQMVAELKSRSSSSQRYETDFQRFKQHLLLHIEKIFATLGKILQQNSIDQSKRKLEVIRRMDTIGGLKSMQPRLESLYNFMETALESIVESYMKMIIAEKGKHRHSENNANKVEMQLRIDELERKWISERERRKLDNDAAETRIGRLEAENELLREKLYNMTIRK